MPYCEKELEISTLCVGVNSEPSGNRPSQKQWCNLTCVKWYQWVEKNTKNMSISSVPSKPEQTELRMKDYGVLPCQAVSFQQKADLKETVLRLLTINPVVCFNMRKWHLICHIVLRTLYIAVLLLSDRWCRCSCYGGFTSILELTSNPVGKKMLNLAIRWA